MRAGRTEPPAITAEQEIALFEGEIGPEFRRLAIVPNCTEYFNRHAARGEDPLFQKTAEYLKPLDTPPFAALDYRTEAALWTVFTMGGLHTTVDGEVLSPDEEKIPGLYAAGRTTSGLAAQGYSSGLSIADATFFGRRAGSAAARNA